MWVNVDVEVDKQNRCSLTSRPMTPCDFCPQPAERRLWARRWPVLDGRRRRDDVQDVRLALCGDHLRQRISGGALLIKQGWAYD